MDEDWIHFGNFWYKKWMVKRLKDLVRRAVVDQGNSRLFCNAPGQLDLEQRIPDGLQIESKNKFHLAGDVANRVLAPPPANIHHSPAASSFRPIPSFLVNSSYRVPENSFESIHSEFHEPATRPSPYAGRCLLLWLAMFRRWRRTRILRRSFGTSAASVSIQGCARFELRTTGSFLISSVSSFDRWSRRFCIFEPAPVAPIFRTFHRPAVFLRMRDFEFNSIPWFNKLQNFGDPAGEREAFEIRLFRESWGYFRGSEYSIEIPTLNRKRGKKDFSYAKVLLTLKRLTS